jgi:hypothetical protein
MIRRKSKGNQQDSDGFVAGCRLPCSYIGGMDVLNPAFCRIRRLTMTSNTEEQANPPAAATVQPPRATKRAHFAPRTRRVAPDKPSSRKKATSAERRPKSQNAAKQAKPAAGAREGSKAAKVLGLLRRPGGASLKELMKATGWLAHSVRGFLSGTVAKRMKLKLVSAKNEDGERRYSLKS